MIEFTPVPKMKEKQDRMSLYEDTIQDKFAHFRGGNMFNYELNIKFDLMKKLAVQKIKFI